MKQRRKHTHTCAWLNGKFWFSMIVTISIYLPDSCQLAGRWLGCERRGVCRFLIQDDTKQIKRKNSSLQRTPPHPHTALSSYCFFVFYFFYFFFYIFLLLLRLRLRLLFLFLLLRLRLRLFSCILSSSSSSSSSDSSPATSVSICTDIIGTAARSHRSTA